MSPPRPRSALRDFLDAQSSSGLILMGAAALALAVANSPLQAGYEAILDAHIGPLSLLHWINDGLMALFFLLVGLEIKREWLDGELSSWPRRALPGIAALGGMAVPALIYLAFNPGPAARGWAIPAATDIAFALGVVALLGQRVPTSLRLFLVALAIIDDLGAVAIIALFYTAELSLPDVAGAAAVTAVLIGFNRFGVRRLAAYLLCGVLLWFFVLRSGVHATLAGVILALAIPLRASGEASPLHRLEHKLDLPVALFVLPLFGLANAGVPLLGLGADVLAAPVSLGVGLGLLAGKVAGVLGFALLAVRLGISDLPAHASRAQLGGVSLLCGIGFTMSLFITLLAFPGEPMLQMQAKIGILGGSLLSGLLGYAVLRRASATRQ